MNSYYHTKGVREICHDVKNTSSNKDAILTMAEHFSDMNILDESCIIIPAPQHYGYADYTLQIAERVSKATGAKILDILKCHPRDMLYDLKKQGKGNVGDIPDLEHVYTLDMIADECMKYSRESKRAAVEFEIKEKERELEKLKSQLASIG